MALKISPIKFSSSISYFVLIYSSIILLSLISIIVSRPILLKKFETNSITSASVSVQVSVMGVI
jgi:hypothetical protein